MTKTERVNDVSFHAETYDLIRVDSGYPGRSCFKLEPRLQDRYEYGEPIKTVRGSDPFSGSTFQICKFYAAPPSGQISHAPTYNLHDKDDSDLSTRYYSPETRIYVRAEIGCLLIIRSEAILEALRTISGNYPGLFYKGEALVLPEPYCLLLHYRTKLAAYADPRRIDTKETELPDGVHQDHGNQAGLTQPGTARREFVTR